MIEVCNTNVWYKKRRKKTPIKRIIKILITLLIIFLIYFYYQNYITEQVLRICGDYSEVCATESVNNAVLQSLKTQINYSDLVTIEKNSNGNVSLMTANSYKINSISREISNNSLNNLTKKLEKGVPVPLLSFTGIGLLAGYGGVVNYKAVYVSNVVCNFTSKFESVGINQTLHSIYIDVNSEIKLEMPAKKLTKICNSQVLICETIIVGQVPEIYLNGNLFDNLLKT